MQPDQLRARSCPTCHSIGEPYVIDRTLGSNEPIRCKNLWHIEVREPPSAEYHKAHRDDPEEWGEAMEPGKPRRRLASMISVRLGPDEVRQIREAAERVGETVSTFLRTAALDRAATAPPARQDSPGATGDATAVPEATERHSAGCDDCDDVCTEKCTCPGCTAPQADRP